MKIESIKFVSVLYHISLSLVKVKYFVVIGVIYMLLKTLSSVLGTLIFMLIVQVLYI